MSTNYYVKIPGSGPCTTCGRSDREDEYHIGKYSAGWRFIFNPRFKTAAEWREFLKEYKEFIYDEYGCSVDYEDLWRLAEDSRGGRFGHEAEHLDPEGYRISHYADFR